MIPPDFDRDNDALFISPVYSDPLKDNILYYAGGKYIYRNNDVELNQENYEQPSSGAGYESKNWERLDRAVGVGSISAFGGSINRAHRLYYGTSAGYIYRLDNSDKNDKAVSIKNNIGGSGYISSISVDPYDGDRLIVSYSSYETKSIFYSENAGQSWTDVSGNLEENVSGYGAGPSVRSVYIYPLKNGYRYFAGTSTGLYSTSTLNGTSTKWVLEGAETIGNIVVDMIDGRPSDGYIAIATHGNGMYSARFNTNELSVNDTNIPEKFELAQNYPNPFNPSTRISFDLVEPGQATLIIYNLLGKRINILLNRTMDAGHHRVEWNGLDMSGQPVSSGVYFYELRSEKYIARKKMILLR